MPVFRWLTRTVGAVMANFWRTGAVLGLLGPIVIVMAVGCRESGNPSNHLPAPLRDDFPYELKFQGSRVWEPEGFEIDLDGVLHRIVLASVEPPHPDSLQRQIAIDTLRDFVGNANGRALVQGRDRYQREIAQVFVAAEPNKSNPLTSSSQGQDQSNEVDVGLRLIELGLARCSVSQMNLSPEYQQAESTARAEKRGIWNSN